MPAVPPPTSPKTTPDLVPLSSGTVLFRIHQVRFAADAFSPVLSHKYFGGGRFDATADDTYSYLYAGDAVSGAVAEMLLRDSPINATGAITVPRVAVSGRRLSAVRVATDLTVVALTGLTELRNCSQDTWLVQANPPEYPQTRHWGHWIRAQAPTAHGFVWLSKRDPTKQSYVLFGDRCPSGALVDSSVSHLPTDGQQPFDDSRGRAHLRLVLAPFNADVA